VGTPAPDEGSLPKLLYVYDPQSFAPLSITQAAAGVCRFVWVVDSSKPNAAITVRLLRKFGPVVDSSDGDMERVAAEARAHQPDGVLSMHDSDLLWTAELAELLQLPFHSRQTALKLTDKRAQRAALASAGLVVPLVQVIAADADATTVADIAATFTYPAVLKPRFGQSSRNTLPISSGAELTATLEELRGQPDWVAEDYVLEGFVPDATTEVGGRGFASFVSVESVVENGRVEHASISSRTPFRWPFRETGYCTPTALSAEHEAEVFRVAGEAARALGVTVGCLHTEIKLTDEGPVVIEVNGRPGGGMSEMLERASGFSILRTALRLAVGDPVGLQGPVACSRIGYLLYVFPETDVECIDSVEGLDELRKVDGVDEIVLVRGPGQRIDWREGSEAHVFHLTGTTRDFDELQRLIDATVSLVRIEGHNEDASSSSTPSPSPASGALP
jgi:glutathione synthase/RimK-type ligase-like ATP-grasp enzyme